MFNFFKPASRDTVTPGTKSVTLHLSGLHCTSCAVSIDLALEDLPGVKSTTNYAKSVTTVEYDPQKTTLHAIHAVILDLGYQIIS